MTESGLHFQSLTFVDTGEKSTFMGSKMPPQVVELLQLKEKIVKHDMNKLKKKLKYSDRDASLKSIETILQQSDKESMVSFFYSNE